MSKRNWTWLLLCVAFFTLALVGCSSKDREVGSPSSDATVDVTFNFNLQKDAEIVTKALVPHTVAKFVFIGYQDDTKVYPASSDCLVENKAEVTEDGQLQSVTLPDVPITVNNFIIQYLATDDAVVAVTAVTGVELTSSAPNVITVGDEETPIVESSLIVKIAPTVEYPEETTHYNVALYDSTGKLIIATVPAEIAKLSDVTFDETALNTAKVYLNWYNGEELLGYTVADAPENMLPGQEKPYEITIEGQFTPVKINLSLINCYKLQTAPQNGVKLIVTNGDREIETSAAYSDEGKYALNVPLEQDESISITSIVLKDADTDTPFEWLDYSTPITKYKADLDVEENEFANGKFETGKTMEVANPRQLDNIHNQRNAEDNTIDGDYKQIKDIDFAGSCGSTLKASETLGKGAAYVYDLDKANKNARFFGNEEEKLFGWVPIAGKNLIDGQSTKVNFIGTYDGNGFKISNLVMDYSLNSSGIVSRVGLFGQIRNGSLKNITLDETCQFVADNSLGSICGSVEEKGGGTITGCKTSALVCGHSNFGGILGIHQGNAEATVSDCQTIGAQIIGLYNGEGEYFTPSIDYNTNYAGIVGRNAGSETLYIVNCTCDQDTKITQLGDKESPIMGTTVGGMIGSSAKKTHIKDCNFLGTIYGSVMVGGLVGLAEDELTLENCHNAGTIIRNPGGGSAGNNFRMGGLIGTSTYIPTFSTDAPCSCTGTISIEKNTYNTNDHTVAGVIALCGSSTSSTVDVEELKAAMKGCIKASVTPTGGFEHPHMYSGAPALDEL